MPVLFFAVKAADSAAVEILLQKGADTSAKLSTEVKKNIDKCMLETMVEEHFCALKSVLLYKVMNKII